ncbi:sialate O-acetylesterase, partial [Pseudarcicella hirudinis]
MKYSSNTGLFNRKCLSHFFVIEFLFFFLLIFWLSANNTFSQTSVKISLPLDRTVFQQSTANNATFQLAGQINYYYPSSMGSTLEYQIESLSRTGEVIATTQSWTGTGINYATSSGFFNKTLTLSTGWYRISVRYNTNYSGSIKSNAIKVGVGEVLFAAGQSNAQGVEMGGSNKGGIPDLKGNYDCINAVNQNCWCKQTYDFPIFKQMEYSAEDKVSRIAPNGNQTLWCYQALGKQIVDKNTNVVTPVVFFNAGSGGTGIDNWSTSAGNPNGTTINPLGGYQNCQSNFADWNSEGPQGHPYRGLKTGLNYYGGMLGTRGVIWHQGESDTKENTSEVSYRDKFRAVIQQTRNDFNSNLGWAISRVSRLQYNENIITSDAVKRGQAYINSSASSLSNITWGGYYSDEIADRLPDNTHFNASGLLKLAELYATGNFAGNTAGGNQGGAILSLTPVEFNNRPSLAVNVTRPNTGEITMTVSGSHNGYKWVKNEGKISEAIYFTQGITVNNDGTDKWRCYVSDNKGNVAITQEVALPVREAIVVGTECPSGTFRPSSDKITCDEISGWVFRDNANGPYGVVDVYVDGYKKNTITANLSKYYYGEGGSRGFASNEGYIYNVPANASWRDGVNHTVSVRQCNYNVDFASASLNCPTNSGGPSCDNGASPFSMTSVNYNSSSRCVEYQFNANNLSNANWSIKQGNTTLYSGSLPQPITSNTGTVNCGVTLASGTYDFVLTGVSCNGTTTRAFTV